MDGSNPTPQDLDERDQLLNLYVGGSADIQTITTACLASYYIHIYIYCAIGMSTLQVYEIHTYMCPLHQRYKYIIELYTHMGCMRPYVTTFRMPFS